MPSCGRPEELNLFCLSKDDWEMNWLQNVCINEEKIELFHLEEKSVTRINDYKLQPHKLKLEIWHIFLKNEVD